MNFDYVSSFEGAIANHLWQSTMFALCVALLAWSLHKNQARVRSFLWLAASIKFLIPFSLLAEIGRMVSVHHATNLPAFYFVIDRASHPFSDFSTLSTIAAMVWAAGFATVSVLCAVRYRRALVLQRNARLITAGREVDTLRRLENRLAVQPPIPLYTTQSTLEPGVFGVFRPVLLWPEQISRHLTDAHLEAILAHEVQHVRRRDNLVAALHMLTEAIFWFHPLVWWLGARMVDERERACDEAVLMLGNSPQIYAESILTTCKFSMASPLPCISGVAGGDLKQRIVRILSSRIGAGLGVGKKVLLFSAGFVILTTPIVFEVLRAPLAGAEIAPLRLHASSQIYHIGGEVTAPKLVYAPDPQYSEKARKAKYQGLCVVNLVVDEKGKPKHVEVARELGMGLDKQAVDAVKQYRFEPAMLHGKPVPVSVNIEVNFRLY